MAASLPDPPFQVYLHASVSPPERRAELRDELQRIMVAAAVASGPSGTSARGGGAPVERPATVTTSAPSFVVEFLDVTVGCIVASSKWVVCQLCIRLA
jgi:hypothetical protein